MKLQLNPGHRIHDPKTEILVPADRPFTVERNSFWLRRIKDGSVKLLSDEKVYRNKNADINKDGKVDEEDLSIVHKEYHKDKNKKGK